MNKIILFLDWFMPRILVTIFMLLGIFIAWHPDVKIMQLLGVIVWIIATLLVFNN